MTRPIVPHSSAQAFEDRMAVSSASYAANGMNHNPRGGQRTPLEIESFSAFEGKEIPEAEWLIGGFIPMSDLTLLGGEGGIGKSQLAIQLGVACHLGKPWLGVPSRQCASLMILCEDTRGEVHRRAARVAEHYDTTLGDLPDCHFVSRVGRPNFIYEAKSDYEPADRSAFFDDIRGAADRLRVKLIVLDSNHNLFGANENSRIHVPEFCSLLRGMAQDLGAAVVLLTHPSLAGINTGTGLSGSTSWHNGCRARFYLKSADPQDKTALMLECMKINQGPKPDPIRLAFQGGVLIREGGMVSQIKGQKAEVTFLAALAAAAANGVYVTPGRTSPSYAPKVLALRAEAEGLSKTDLERAMEGLLARGEIVTVMHKKSDRKTREVLTVKGAML